MFTGKTDGLMHTLELPYIDIHNAKLISSLVECNDQDLTGTTTGCLQIKEFFNIKVYNTIFKKM